MTQINCYIPIKIRITGRLTDVQLDQLGEAIVRSVAARLEFAERTILASGSKGFQNNITELVRDTYNPSAQVSSTSEYNVPAYQSGGTLTRVPIRRQDTQQHDQEIVRRQKQITLRRIHELLSTGVFDWFVTDEEAHQVLRILQGLSPEVLLYTVMVMKSITDTWNTFRRELPDSDRQALYELEMTIDPNVGYIMPGDTIQVEIYSSSTSREVETTEFTVEREGVRLPMLSRPVSIVGMFPKAAVNAIADAYIDGLILAEPFVRVGVSRRGIYYAGRNQGPFSNPIFFASTRRADPSSPLVQQRHKQAEFISYIAGVNARDAFILSALGYYLKWIETHHDSSDFLTQTPANLWEAALSHAAQPVPTSPLQPFLELAQSMLVRLNVVPPQEKARIQDTLNRYTAWIDLHRNDPSLSQYNPIEIWSRAYRRTLNIELQQMEARYRQKAAERTEEVDWQRVERKFDEALKLMMTRVWQMPAPRIAENRQELIGYLITGSETEHRIRDQIARVFLDDVVRRMTEAGFTSTSTIDDFNDWLQKNPQLYQQLLIAQAKPEVEKYEIHIDIPAWQTAIETAIGFVPIVGQIVGGYEVIAGQDLFGNPLSTTDRAILGAAILLPAAARIFRVGRAAVTASRIAREYRLTAQEAEVLFRATAKIQPGSANARLLSRAAEDIRSGKPIRDPQRLGEMETLLRDMGMTDRSTARSLTQRGSATAEAEVAEHAPRLAEVERPPISGRGSSGGGIEGGIPPGRGTTLLQQQRGAALRTEAASLEREIAALRQEADALEREAVVLQETRPDRASRLSQQAARRRRVAETLESDVADFRRQAQEFESGARSATEDLPGPQDIDLLFAEARPETELIRVPLARAERNPSLLPRLLRPLMQSRTGNRVVFRVEGGGSRQLITLAANGDVTIARGSTIHLNFGSYDRAVEFLQQNRRPGARIIAFEVNEQWVQSARSAAIPEFRTGSLRGKQPRLVDIRFAEDQMEIPASLIDEFLQFIIPGSGRVLQITP